MNIAPDVMNGLDIRSRTILHCCERWYSQESSRCIFLLRVLQRKAGYSLRTIDWMVTNYCKRKPVTVVCGGNPVSVHNDYERHLTVYNKRYYDPFARREKIAVTVTGVKITTTVGQLNFFKWFIERGLDEIVRNHKTDIEADMKGDVETNVLAPKNTVVHRGNFQVGFL